MRDRRQIAALPGYRRTSCTGVIRGTPVIGCASTKTRTSKTSLSNSGVSTSVGRTKRHALSVFHQQDVIRKLSRQIDVMRDHHRRYLVKIRPLSH